MKKNYFVLTLLLVFGTSWVQSQSISDTVFNQIDAHGKRQGHWKKVYRNGNIAYQGYFKDDKPRGEFLRYHENSVLSAKMIFSECGDTSTTTLYSSAGRQLAHGLFVNKQKHGVWRYYNDRQQVVYQEEFKNGMKDGNFLVFYPEGRVYERIVWKNNEKNGVTLQYYPDGTLMSSISYVNGVEDGPIKTFYGGGQVRLEGNYKNGLKEGDWIIYDPEQKVMRQISYVKGIASNADELALEETRELDALLKNIGRIQDPTIEEFIEAGAF